MWPHVWLCTFSLPLFPAQIEQEEVHASLDQAGQMVSFSESPESYDSVLMAAHLEQQLQQCMALEEKLKTFNQQMALDPRFLTRVSLNGREGESP